MSEKESIKLGLALSGGGFRASYFHLGVLRTLAKKDLLRQVEVISTVSGGTIIGVLYYLAVKKLFENKIDSEISSNDFLEIINKIESDFLKFTSRNLRMLSFVSVKKNIKIALLNNNFFDIITGSKLRRYSRTHHIGELIEEYLYREYISSNEVPLRIENLHIKTKADRNSYLKNKIPTLMINTTCLNNGAGLFITEEGGHFCYPTNNISKTAKYYELSLQGMLLSDAVAASASVPGIFEPVSIRSSNTSTPHSLLLVDGGVFDNQGIEGLLYQECNNFIISDGSRQMEFEFLPFYNALESILKVNDVLMNSNRDKTLDKIHLLHPNSMAIPHLLYGIEPYKSYPRERELDITFLRENIINSSENQVINSTFLNYISEIRTDLDSFTETEAFILAYTGMKISEEAINSCKSIACLVTEIHETKVFQFDQSEGLLNTTPIPSKLEKQLKLSGDRFFKWPKISDSNNILLKILSKIVVGITRISFNFVKLTFTKFMFFLWLLLIGMYILSRDHSHLIMKIPLPEMQPFWALVILTFPFTMFPILCASLISLRSLIIYISLKTLNKWYLKAGEIRGHS